MINEKLNKDILDLINENKTELLTKLNSIIKVVKVTHSYNCTSTGWKKGNFNFSNIQGYKLIAVQSLDIPYGDSNSITYNVYDNKVYWISYVGYSGNSGTANANLIYVNENFIS